MGWAAVFSGRVLSEEVYGNGREAGKQRGRGK
jgi:hypothetical protein